MNKHYYNRYMRIIEMLRNSPKPISGHHHHIIPRCQGGGNQAENIIFVSIRMHYILHLILAKCEINKNLVFAWNMMRRNAKSSRNFESLLKMKYDILSDSLKGRVSIQNIETKQSYFESVELAKELVLSGHFKYCGSGFVVIRDQNGETFSIPKEEYDKEIHTHSNCDAFSVYDKSDGTNKRINHQEYHTNRDRYITNLDNKVYVHHDDKIISITKEEYSLGNYKSITAGKVVVYDEFNKKIQITKEEYDLGKHRSIKANKVNVYFLDGSTGSVSREEFKANKHLYRTHNAGLVICVDLVTGKTIQVPCDEFKKFKNIKYRHISAGLELTCPHCNKTGGSSMRRWHFNNCRNKEK